MLSPASVPVKKLLGCAEVNESPDEIWPPMLITDPARMTKSSRRFSHRRRQLTRRFLGNAHHEGLRVDGRRRWRFREREKARRTQVHVPAVEDRYVLLAIHYMNICVQGAAIGGVVGSSLVLIRGLRCLGVSPP